MHQTAPEILNAIAPDRHDSGAAGDGRRSRDRIPIHRWHRCPRMGNGEHAARDASRGIVAGLRWVLCCAGTCCGRGGLGGGESAGSPTASRSPRTTGCTGPPGPDALPAISQAGFGGLVCGRRRWPRRPV